MCRQHHAHAAQSTAGLASSYAKLCPDCQSARAHEAHSPAATVNTVATAQCYMAVPAPCHRDVMPCVQSLQSLLLLMQQPTAEPRALLSTPDSCKEVCCKDGMWLITTLPSSPYISYVEAVQHSMRAYALPGCEAGPAGRAAPLLHCRDTHTGSQA